MGAAAIAVTLLGSPIVILVAIALLAGVVGLWASFAITTQEPRISLQEDSVTWRKTIRFCAAVAVAGSLAEQLGSFGGGPAILLVSGQVLSLVGLVAAFGELLYYSRFALRIPDSKLARSTRTVMWGSTISWTVLICVGITGLLFGIPVGGMPARGAPATAAPPAGGGTAFAVVTVLLLVAAVPLFVFFVWYVVLLVRYKRVFTTAVAEARAFGSSPDTTVPPSSAM